MDISQRHSLLDGEGASRPVDRILLGAVAALLALGVLMVFSTTAVPSQEVYGRSTWMLKRHIVHIALGLVLLFAFVRLPPDKYKLFALPALLGTLVLLAVVLVPSIGLEAGGARRWLPLGAFRLQPGEVAKLALVLYFAAYIDRHRTAMQNLFPGVFVPLCILGVFAVLLLLEPDFGTAVVLAVVVGGQLLTASRLSHLFAFALAGAAGAAALIVSSPYRLRRVNAFLDPFADASSSGYQLIQSLIAVGSGGIFGLGLGAGKQKLYYLPAAHTDFIYAVVAEELGLLGALFVLLLFLLILQRGVRISRRLSGDAFLCSLAVGCTLLLVVPALLNMAVVLGLLPTKGMVLPLVAYGGSAMVMHLAAAGMLLGLSRLVPQ